MMKLKLPALLLLPLGEQPSLPARSQQLFTYSSQSLPLAVDHLVSSANVCDRQVHTSLNAGSAPLSITEICYSRNEMPGECDHPASTCFPYLINDKTAY